MLQTFPGHYVRIPKKYLKSRNVDDPTNRHQIDGVVEAILKDGSKDVNVEAKSKSNDKIKSSHDKIWPNNKYLRSQNNQKLLQNGKLKEFRGNDLIALASFPGSGNTWLRYLLQQATGEYNSWINKNNSLYEMMP